MTRKVSLIADSTKMFTANVTASLFGVARGIVVAGALGPTYYGIWNIFNVIISYIPYIHFGLLDGMTKHMPRLRAQGKFQHSKMVGDNAFSIIIMSALIVPMMMIVISFLFQGIFSREVVIGFRILAGLIALFHIYIFLTAFIRIDERFGLLSVVTGVIAVFSLLFMLLFFKMFYCNLYAALTGMVAAYLLMDIFVLVVVEHEFRFRIDLSVLREILYLGFPIGLTNIVYVLFISVDRWIIATFLGRLNLGYYGFAFTISNFLVILPMSIAFTLYTKMLHRYGQTNDPRSSERLVYFPALGVSFMMSVACVLAAILMPVLILIILPAYTSGIDVVVILVLAGYFMSIVPVFANFLISIDKQMQIFITQVVAIILNVTINTVLIKLGCGIKGVAFGTGFSYLFYATAIVLFALLNFTSKLKELLLRTGELYLPYFTTLAIFLIFKFIFKLAYTGGGSDIFVAVFQSSIVIITVAPFVFYLNKKIAVFDLVKEIFRH